MVWFIQLYVNMMPRWKDISQQRNSGCPLIWEVISKQFEVHHSWVIFYFFFSQQMENIQSSWEWLSQQIQLKVRSGNA